ncbi:MAG: hypothetical protein FWG03_00665 [Clostridiales bacterium]|nr:hypothetical protein [Clostridiales bacterium]
MEYLKIIRDNEILRDTIDIFCDVLIEGSLTGMDGTLGYSLEKFRVFGRDAGGGVYGFIGKGDFARLPVGYVSSEGPSGKIAANIDDFFHLITFCPFWYDLCRLRGISKEAFAIMEEEARQDDEDYDEMQGFIAEQLGLDKNADVLGNLYSALTTGPRFVTYATEDNSPSEPLVTL